MQFSLKTWLLNFSFLATAFTRSVCGAYNTNALNASILSFKNFLVLFWAADYHLSIASNVGQNFCLLEIRGSYHSCWYLLIGEG